jgi:hypothetical protein
MPSGGGGGSLASMAGGGGTAAPMGVGGGGGPGGASAGNPPGLPISQLQPWMQNYLDAMQAMQATNPMVPLSTNWQSGPGGNAYHMQNGQLISRDQLNYDIHGYGGTDPEGAGVPMRGFVGAPAYGPGMVAWPASLGGAQAGGSVGYPGQVGPKFGVQGIT